MGKTECAAAPVNALSLSHNLPPSPAAPPSPPFAPSPEGPPPDVPVSAWLPADLDAHIPAHIIATNLSRVHETSNEVTPDKDFNPTPLDNLLAVAELEFNQQHAIKDERNFTLDLESNATNLHQHLSKFTFLTEEDCDQADMLSFDIHNPVKQDGEDMFFPEKVPDKVEQDVTYQPNMVVSKDLFESITEAHYLPDLANHPDESINANDLLDSLVEKGCEDHIIGNAFEKLAHLVNHASGLHEEYASEGHSILLHGAHDADILSRFEQSLDSPSQNSMTAAQGLLHLQQMSEQLAKQHMQLTVSDTAQYDTREYNMATVNLPTGGNNELHDDSKMSDQNIDSSVHKLNHLHLDSENVQTFVNNSRNSNLEPNNNDPISNFVQINTLNMNLCGTEVASTNSGQSTQAELRNYKLNLGEVLDHSEDVEIKHDLSNEPEKKNEEVNISDKNVQIMKVTHEQNTELNLTLKQTTEALLTLAQCGIIADVVQESSSTGNSLHADPKPSDAEEVRENNDMGVHKPVELEVNINSTLEKDNYDIETRTRNNIEAEIKTGKEIIIDNSGEISSDITTESSNNTSGKPQTTIDVKSSTETQPNIYFGLQKEIEEETDSYECKVDNNKKEISKPIDSTQHSDDDKNEDLPKDLSCHKRSTTPYTSPKQLESASCSSSQPSPQRSNLSPNISLDAFTIPPPTTSASKSLFLETLLASPPAKMCLNSEVTITKTQHEPLNLGRTRKSESPVVTITAEECRKTPRDQTTEKDYGEPEEKKTRKETSDELALARLNKVLHRSTDIAVESKHKRSERSSSRCSDRQSPKNTERTTPLKQFQMMRLKPEGVPDPLIMPKEKLTAVLSSPAKEIPSLISQRPDLLVSDALAYSTILQDPNILVISLTQLEDILTKQEKILEQLTGKPYLDLNDIKSLSPADIAKSIQRAQVGMMEWARQLPTLESLAGDIDAATTAALNQMIWLPYLSHLEAAAQSCQSSELIQAFNSPSALPAYTAQNTYPDISQFLQPRFLGPGAIPIMHQMDYNTQLEMAMWQEVMAQANTLNVQHQRAVKQAVANDHILSKNAEAQNHYQLSAKCQQNRSQSSARTSPITRNYNGCQRSTNHNYYANAYPTYNSRTNAQATALQVPHYNPAASPHQANQRAARAHHQQQQKSSNSNQTSYYQNNNYLASLKQAGNSRLSPIQKRGSMHGNGLGSVNAYVNGHGNMHSDGHGNIYPNAGNAHMNGHSRGHGGGAETNGRERGAGRPPSQSSSNSQSPHDDSRPRISVKSLQNLLEPSAQQQHVKSHVRPDPYVPIYHGPSMSELMVKPGVPQVPTRRQAVEAVSLQRRMLGHEEDVNPSTVPEEVTHGHMHESQTHLWHPLFGNQKSYNSPWNWTTVTVNGE